MANYKTVPNQKVVKVQKLKCDKQNLYATINLVAMELAAQDLDAGAFKLWCYFSKNQNNYEFALSSTDAANTFGLKKKQYDNAIKTLIEKKYLQSIENNKYIFNEIAVVPKGYNEENSLYQKDTTPLYPKDTTPLYQKDTRNNTNNNTINNTIRNCASAISNTNSKDNFNAIHYLKELQREAKQQSI